MFDLNQIMDYVTNINNVTSLITIISFLLLIVNAYIINSYKQKCEEDYNISGDFFNVDVFDKFSQFGLIMVVAILIVLAKEQEGIMNYIAKSICFFFITILLNITLSKCELKIVLFYSSIPAFIYFINNLFCKCNIINNIVMIFYIIIWICLCIKKFFTERPIDEPKYKIKYNDQNDVNVILSKYNGSFLVVEGEIDENKVLILNTKNYKFISPREYKIEKISGYIKIVVKNKI